MNGLTLRYIDFKVKNMINTSNSERKIVNKTVNYFSFNFVTYYILTSMLWPSQNFLLYEYSTLI